MRFGAAMIAALFHCLAPSGRALAQDVSLTSRDGSLTLDGTLLEFDGEFYRVDTIYGPLTVDALGVSCTGPGCPNLEAFVAEVTISGAESMGTVLVPALLEAFAAARGLGIAREIQSDLRFAYTISEPEGRALARFDFHLSTTAEGFADLVTGEADIAMAAREAGQADVALARDAGIGTLSSPAQSRVVALDAYVAAVAPDSALGAVAPETLARVLAGDVADWGALGGEEGVAVAVHALDPALGAQQAIEAALLAPLGLQVAASARRHADAAALADAVAGDPYAIGVTLASALGQARGLALAGGCGFALAPDEAAVRSEDYPLVAPQFLYTPNRRLPAMARDFLGFLSSPPAERVIRRAGFVDLGARRVPLAQQGERLAKAIRAAGAEVTLADLQALVAALDGADRLSPTFRFRTGAAGLDAPSRSSALLLSEALEAGVYDGRELVFAGFSDGEGGAVANRRIAQSRAETVMNAVRALAETADYDKVRLSAVGFGEAMPIACDDTDWGRRANRRVEVWVR